ncbi:universal stress protein [Streptomyces sp. NBC_01092]|uniref:universal stress protein n=1 Tax=Streptomyces sp. NBC_01092 TaxID=2903748 RepID=UPI00386EB072
MSHPVLAGVDGSEGSSAAADWAALEAASRGVPLRLVHASPSLPGTAVPGPAVDRLHDMGVRMLQRGRRPRRALPGRRGAGRAG